MADWAVIICCEKCGKGNPYNASCCISCGQKLKITTETAKHVKGVSDLCNHYNGCKLGGIKRFIARLDETRFRNHINDAMNYLLQMPVCTEVRACDKFDAGGGAEKRIPFQKLSAEECAELFLFPILADDHAKFYITLKNIGKTTFSHEDIRIHRIGTNLFQTYYEYHKDGQYY